MADPRKPILRPDDSEQDRIRKIAYQHLLKATDAGAQELGCTGATFVVLGMGLWIMELAEVDQKATAQLLAALATLHDPAASKTKKMHAERKRRAAVDKLFSTLDLEMSATKGRA